MAAGKTYEPIATTTVSGTSTLSVTFSSIAGTYTDLVLVSSGAATTAGGGHFVYILNSDTASNYSQTRLFGNGSTATSDRYTNQTYTMGPFIYLVQGNGITHFMNYSNTTTYKTLITRTNASDFRVGAYVGLWRSTSAITSIKIQQDAGGVAFDSGTTFTLYGIAAA